MDEKKSSISTTVPHTTGAPIDAASVRGFGLAIVEGPSAGQSWRSQSDSCTIGSHELCSLVIDDPTVSRFHCEIRIDSSGVRVRDSGSSNGTIVDGVRVADAFLRSGSSIRIGRTVLNFDLVAASNRIPVSEANGFGRLAGRSVAMRRVFSLLEKAAGVTATALLEGETGTGKSAAARAIHAASERAKGPFVMLNCGAIPPGLLESELFGHVKGAFTGAETARLGAFEEADRGTLFLDEVGELSPDLQPKLLGALEDRAVRRVGGTGTRPVDIRLVAATNRDLRREINEGRFRSDLYFRLAVIRVEMPPLRARPEDVPEIAEALLAELGAGPATITRLMNDELQAQLARSVWPGNVRELKNYLERCLVFDEVMPIDSAGGLVAGSVPDTTLSFGDAKKRAISEFERSYLQAILERHGSKVVDAAAAAGIDRTHFYRLMRRHRLGSE